MRDGVHPLRTEKSTNPCRDTIPINFFIKVRFKNDIHNKSYQHNLLISYPIYLLHISFLYLIFVL